MFSTSERKPWTEARWRQFWPVKTSEKGLQSWCQTTYFIPAVLTQIAEVIFTLYNKINWYVGSPEKSANSQQQHTWGFKMSTHKSKTDVVHV